MLLLCRVLFVPRGVSVLCPVRPLQISVAPAGAVADVRARVEQPHPGGRAGQRHDVVVLLLGLEVGQVGGGVVVLDKFVKYVARKRHGSEKALEKEVLKILTSDNIVSEKVPVCCDL